MTARVRGSKRVRRNSYTALKRLEGFTPCVEDWHARVCLLGVNYYNTTYGNIGFSQSDLYLGDLDTTFLSQILYGWWNSLSVSKYCE